MVRSVQTAWDAYACAGSDQGPDDVVAALRERYPGRDPILIGPRQFWFAGLDPVSGQTLVDVNVHRHRDGSYEVGGVVEPAHRGQGYGREALEAACRMAHEHFGIVRLSAHCDVTNVASRRCLAAGGFVHVGGPVTGTRPDGRTVEVLAWEHIDTAASNRCRAYA